MHLLGIHGKKRTGKDTVANILVDLFGNHTTPVVAFADMLKAVCAEFSGIPIQYFYDDRKEEVHESFGQSPRQLMIEMSDLLKGAYGQDVFLNRVRHLWEDRYRQDTRLMIVSDVRYENEAAWIRGEGGMILHLVRATGAVSDHSSEKGIEMLDCDYQISNDGSLEELRAKVEDFLQWWVGPEEVS